MMEYQTQMMHHMMCLSQQGGQGDAVSQLVAYNTRTEVQTRKRDREEFLRRMNSKKELPKIEAKGPDQLLEELEKFDEFLLDVKPKDAFDTLEYMKASLKGKALEVWRWENRPQRVWLSSLLRRMMTWVLVRIYGV